MAGRGPSPVAILGISVVFLIVVWNRLVPSLPGYIAALVLATVAAAVIDLPADTIGSLQDFADAVHASGRVALWRAIA